MSAAFKPPIGKAGCGPADIQRAVRREHFPVGSGRANFASDMSKFNSSQESVEIMMAVSSSRLAQ